MSGPSKVTETAFDPNGLLVQLLGAPVFGETVTILSGQNLAAGAVLGQITSGGKYILSLSGASDGSQTPDAILAAACDASGGDAQAYVYFAGEFNAAKLTLGTAHANNVAFRKALARKGIFVHTPQPA
mgnify:CR=1 FL=1